MANTNADVLRVESALADIASTIRERQNGYANDTKTIAHKYSGGTVGYWTADDEDLNRTGKLTLTKTTQQLELEYDSSHELDVTVNASGDAAFAPTRHMVVSPGTGGVLSVGSASPQTWKTATYEGVLSLGASSAIAGDGTTMEIATGAYYDVTSDRWETTGGVTSARVTVSEGITVYADGNDGSGGPGDELAWLELYHAKVTTAGGGEFVVNDGGNDVDFRVEGDSEVNLLFTNAGNDRVGVGTASPDRRLHVEQTNANADEVDYLLRLTSAYDSSTTDGFGAGIEFELDSDTQDTNYVAGTLAVLWEDESDIDADMVIQLMDAGSLGEVARWQSDGTMWVSNDGIDWSADQISAFSVSDGNYGKIQAHSTTLGGMLIRGYSKRDADDSCGIYLFSYVENDPSDEGAVHIRAVKHDGAGSLTSVGAAGKVFAVENNSTNIFEILGDGGIMATLKSGANQGAAGAAAGELWHDTDDDTVKMGV